MSQLVTASIILFFAGIVLKIIGSATENGKTKFSVGGIIGFVPFGFGNDPELVKVVVAVSVIAAALFIASSGVLR